MQLFDSTDTQPLAAVNRQLLDVLEDIAHKVEIQPNFSIRHPDYKPLELPAEVINRFQRMPEEIQQKYLSLQLRSFLYGIYYNGSLQSTLALNAEGNRLPLDLENNTVLDVDVAFYQRLHESNCGQGHFDQSWSVMREESDGSLAVTKGALRLHIERDKHLQSSEQTAVVGDSVAIRMPKNRVQSGFYVAVSNVGFIRLEDINSHPMMVRIYFNLIPSGAVGAMGSLTQLLNEMAIPFSFKVLYNPKDYHRYDSGVLYFDKRDYQVVREVLQAIYQQTYFKSEVPLFTKQLAPGLGLAEEPDKKFGVQESFGMNRCQILANGLLEAWYQGNDLPEVRMQAILGQFSRRVINLQRSYLNANSEDIYTLLDL